jgi:ATP-binding cassette, subfamily C, bacterial PrsD
MVTAALGVALNLLALSGSLYMMAVYDSVLPSHSIPTLIGLFGMVVAAYAVQGGLEALRSRMLSQIARRFERQYDGRVMQAVMAARIRGARIPGNGLSLLRDFDSVRGFLAGPGPSVLMDLPWMFLFIAVLFLLHPWLGVATLAGAVIMIGLTLWTDRQTRDPVKQGQLYAGRRDGMSDEYLRHAELLVTLGMRGRMLGRWVSASREYGAVQDLVSRRIADYGGISRTFRLFLQSAILTVGALLVIEGEASGGVIFASSILSSRALAPIDQAIANWRGFVAARFGWKRVVTVLDAIPADDVERTLLPAPTNSLTVENIFVTPPGAEKPVLRDVSLHLPAGRALAVVGPSGAGKSSLARAIAGGWPISHGAVRLDGAALDQWHVDELGRHIGYLPQSVELMEGTIADNISRFGASSDESVVAAARAAGAHEMIVRLPHGYETLVGQDGLALSGGQRQRIGLARALFGDPFLVVLDEPNSNLDEEGERALAEAIDRVKKRGGIVVVVTHRSQILAVVDHILALRNGSTERFGDRAELIRATAAPRTLPA